MEASLIAIFAFGVVFVVALLVLAIAFPEPTPFQYTVFRIVLALAVAGVAALIPGFVELNIAAWLKAGGAMAVFAIVYFYSPAQLIGHPTGKDTTQNLIVEVLSACSRRAVYTRMHAQLDHDAMFRSLADCRSKLQSIVARIEPKNLQQMVADIIGELDFIERHKENFEKINEAKLRIIASLEKLSNAAGVSYTLPRSMTEEVFWSIEEANQLPTRPDSGATA
jgi:hypothetical protein